MYRLLLVYGCALLFVVWSGWWSCRVTCARVLDQVRRLAIQGPRCRSHSPERDAYGHSDAMCDLPHWHGGWHAGLDAKGKTRSWQEDRT